MSWETWQAEFYPKDAIHTEVGREAIEHSLQKWRGLIPENLQKHGIDQRGAGLYEGTDFCLLITSSTCSLCIHYWDEYAEECCETCPLAKTGWTPCDQEGSAYTAWRHGKGPGRMIQELEDTLKAWDEEHKQ